jgi:hypothetical protein
MRTSKALALITSEQRRFERLLAEAADERGRLLDRIMVLAEKPMYDPGVAKMGVEFNHDYVAPGDFDDDIEMAQVASRNGSYE